MLNAIIFIETPLTSSFSKAEHGMAQHIQETQPDKQQSRRRRSWVLLTVVFVVLSAILAFTVTALFIVKSQGINQGIVTTLTIVSIIVGILFALLT
jgi:hypothetical protein